MNNHKENSVNMFQRVLDMLHKILERNYKIFINKVKLQNNSLNLKPFKTNQICVKNQEEISNIITNSSQIQNKKIYLILNKMKEYKIIQILKVIYLIKIQMI